MPREVTDPTLLEVLNKKEVVDPAILVQLEGQVPTQPTPEKLSVLQRLGIGTGYGMEQGGLGIAQRLMEMQGPSDMGMEGPNPPANQPNPILDAIKARVASNRQAYTPLQAESNQAPWYSPTAQGIGNVVGGAAVTLPFQPPMLKGKSAIDVLLNSAMQGGTQGFLQPTIGDESVAQNTGYGGLMGLATGLLGSGIGKAYNAAVNPTITATQKLADKQKIPITLGESTGSPFTQGIEHLQEKVPLLGIGGFRAKQNKAADDAAKRSLMSYAKGGDPINSMAENRAFASGLYEDMKKLLPNISDQTIEPKQTQAIATNFLRQYPDIFKKFQDTKTEGLIKDIVSGTKSISITDPLDILSNLYSMPKGSTKIPTTLTFDELWTLRQGIGEKIGQARKAFTRGEIDETAYGQFKKLFGAVSNDLENWANKIGKPEIVETFRAANDAYKNNVVKYDVLQRAYEKAAGPNEQVGQLFSPQKFSTALVNIIKKDKHYGLFKPNEISELSGLANIMHVVERSGQYMARPETGAKLTLPVLSGALAEIAHTVGVPTNALGYTFAAEGGILGITKFLTSTEMGKRLALSASKIEPTSPAMGQIMKMVYTMAPRLSARGMGGQ